MSLTLDYDQDNARVEITVDGLQTAGATLFTIERSTDQVNWTRVRGAINQVVADDDPVLFFDYEYTPGPGVANFYRVVNVSAIEFVGVGAANHDNNTVFDNQEVPLPAGVQEGDLLVAWVSARSSPLGTGSTGSVQSTTGSSWEVDNGYSRIAGENQIPDPAESFFAVNAVYAKIATSTESNPTVRTLGSPVSAQIAAFRSVDLSVLSFSPRLNGAPAQNIVTPALTVPEDNALILALGTKQDDWTSVDPPTGFTEIDESDTTLGNDQGLTWAYQIQAAATDIPVGLFSVTGGSAAISYSVLFAFPLTATSGAVLFSDSVATPLEVAWLKNPLRPPRNMIVKLGRPEQLRRAARSGLFDIKGRADPIEITEIRRSIAWIQPFTAETFGEVDGLLDLFEPGETLLLHVPGRGDPEDCPPWPDDLPGGYIHVWNVEEVRAPDAPLPRVFTAPVQKVAGPRPELGFIEPPESSS